MHTEIHLLYLECGFVLYKACMESKFMSYINDTNIVNTLAITLLIKKCLGKLVSYLW